MSPRPHQPLDATLPLLDSGARAHSSVGRAPPRQGGGHWFEPSCAHPVIGTYVAALVVCGASLAIGEAAIGLCGVRKWSWLSPAVGVALLCAVCWGTVRLPGNGTLSAIAVLALAVAAVAFLRGRVEGVGEAMRAGAPVAVLALAAASLPFAVEGHFGILGTGFNPDMSQHLLAADRLAHGQASQLLHQGYPLGPHSIVVALNKGLGIGFVRGFSGLTVAVAVLAPLTALAAFADLPPLRRTAGALLVGLPYMVASYFAQGAFKETMEALLVLAFVLSFREASRNPAWRDRPLRFVPAALIAVGSVYTYSFPGLIWPIATVAIWASAELVVSRLRPTATTGPAATRSVFLACLAFLVLIAPEIGRMIDFHSFETFDPNGPGLGNLFGQVSPFEALGIWPSGDFRLAPGDGAVPAIGYYLGAAFALALLLHGLVRCWRRRETAIVSGLAAAAVAYTAARVGGTPYTAAKAIEIAAPLAALAILLPLLRPDPGRGEAVPRNRLGGSRGCRIRSYRHRLFAACPGQRADRAGVLLACPHRAAPTHRLRLDPRARRAAPAPEGTRRALHRLGVARRPGLHRRRGSPWHSATGGPLCDR